MIRPFGTLVLAVACSVSLVAGPAVAEKPSTVKLLPKETTAYFSINDAKDLAARLELTSMGKMYRDPQLKPLVDDLYGTLAQLMETVEVELGVTLSEMWRIPQGEMAIGLVAPEGERPSFVAFVEARDGLPTLMKLVRRGTEALEDQGAVKNEETVNDTRFTVFDLPGGRERQLMYFEKDGTIVIGNNMDTLKGVLTRWKGGAGETLSQNENFTNIMNRCRGEGNEAPQITWFIDPITTVRRVAVNNPGAQLGLALLPTIGLDGLLGVGGSVSLATESFDSITHTHLLLDSPRDGVIKALAITPGDTTPERWVPSDAASYMTINWDFSKSFRIISELIDSFPTQGDGATARAIQRGLDPVGIDFEKELLPSFAGRISYTNWVERPVTPTSQTMLVGIKLADPEAFQPIFDKLVERFEDRVVEQNYAGKKYYEVSVGRQRDFEDQALRRRPCVGIIGDYILMTDRASAMQHAIVTQSDASKSLAGSLEFKLISSKIGRLAVGGKPSMISFNRPEEGMRFVYDLVNSDNVRNGLANQAENNDFFRRVNDALQKNPLPPFAVLQQYLAPGGSLLVDDETGFHYTTFNLKRKSELD